MGELITAAQVKTMFPKRNANTHKGDYGYITLIGGCVKYSGAVRLAALANSAMRSGAGVCTVASPKSLTNVILPQILESTFYPLSDEEGNIIFKEEELDELMEKSDVIAFGMGIGNTVQTRKAVKYLIDNYEGILIVDADGINALAKIDKAAVKDHKGQLVLTPHPKEFSRLSKMDVKTLLADAEHQTKRLAEELNATILLKGHTSIVSDGAIVYRVEKGNAGMATAGSGDVLAGILAAMIASNKKSILLATASAAYINGRAGEIASEEHGEVSMLAGDTAMCVQKAIQEICSGSGKTEKLQNQAPKFSESKTAKKNEASDQDAAKPVKEKASAKSIIFAIIFALLLIAVCGYTGWYAAEEKKALEAYILANTDPREAQEDYITTLSFVKKDIYIDGILVNNYQLYKPFVLSGGKIFVPLTEDVCSALGIKAEWNEKKPDEITITKTEANHSGIFYDLCGWNLEDVTGYAAGNVTIIIDDGEGNTEKLFPDISQVFKYDDGTIMYLPISMLAKSDKLDISTFYDNVSGLYISTDPEIDAEMYYSENNAAYITGRAEYILEQQPNLGIGNCISYEYLFRHEANTREISEDLLLAIARTESRFDKYSISAAGARGIMQIMPDTARANGVDPEKLFEVHTSIQFGSAYIRDAITNFKGDMLKALSVYNFGGNAVLEGAYDTGYATTVLSRMEALEKQIIDKGYSNEFYTVLECTK